MRSAQANAKANQRTVISAPDQLPALAEVDRNDSPERIGIGGVVAHAQVIIVEGRGGIGKFTIKIL
jgi:hypothetical protein